MTQSAPQGTTRATELAPYVIDPRTTLDHAHLIVRSLDTVLPFYTDVLRFKVHRREEHTDGRFVALGAGAHDLLRLSERPNAPSAEGTGSLYHLSFLVNDRAELAQWLRRIAESKTPVEGLVHHAPAAEAIYLPDPEGNTVELNWDPPREKWERREGRPPFSGNLPLDTDSLFKLLEGKPDEWDGPPSDTIFSHIHLYHGDLAAGTRFYVDVLGFEVQAELGGGAVFVSAGNYHHHVGFNVWKGRGIPPQPEGVTGLHYYVVKLPNASSLAEVLERVRAAGIPTRDVPETANAGTLPGVLIYDPAGLGVVLTAPSAA